MRRRGLMAVPVVLASLLGGATTASAADSLKMYRVTVDEESVGALSGLGVDLGHTGYKASLDRAQTIFVDLLDKQAAAARADGLALEEVVAGPARVRDADREAPRARTTARPPPRSRSRRPAATRRTRSTTSSARTPSRAASRTR